MGTAPTLLTGRRAATLLACLAALLAGPARAFSEVDVNASGSSSPGAFVVVDGAAYFAGTDLADETDDDITNPVSDRELFWALPDGTFDKVNVNAAGSSFPDNLTNVGGVLFFTATESATGTELYRYDGDALTPFDLNTGAGSSSPFALTVVGTSLFFVAYDGTANRLWMSDGSADMPVPVGIVVDEVPVLLSWPSGLTAIDGVLFFAATDGTRGDEPWKFEEGEATLLRDINNGGEGSGPSRFTASGGNVFFVANNGSSGDELWKYDGAAVSLVANINTQQQGNSSNGNTQGSNPHELTDVDGLLFFAADDGITGIELWMTDGVVTSLVADLFPGAVQTGNKLKPNGSRPRHLTAINGRLVFNAEDGVNRREFWTWDDGVLGMVNIRERDSQGQAGSQPGDFTVIGDLVFFSANSVPEFGRELWVTDGTVAGTRLVRDINEAGSADPGQFSVVGDLLLFSADDGVNGRELWASDGTTGGTILLADVNPLSSNPGAAVAMGNGYVIFAADTETSGREPVIQRVLAVIAERLGQFEGDTGSAPMTLAVRLLAPLPDDIASVSVDYVTAAETATEDVDYGAVSGTAVLSNGTPSVDVAIPIHGDLLMESDETFALALSTAEPDLVLADGQGTILDDDSPPTVRFGVSVMTINEADIVVDVLIRLSRGFGVPVSVPFTVAGTATLGVDYTVSGSPVVIPAGLKSGSIQVTILADDVVDPNETVEFTLGEPENGVLGEPSVHTLIIRQPGKSASAMGLAGLLMMLLAVPLLRRARRRV